MTREEVVKLAREAHPERLEPSPDVVPVLERFAALVTEAEREACIDLVAMYGGPVDLEAAIRARGAADDGQQAETYDQQALEACEVCGWKTRIPGDACLNCERDHNNAEVRALWAALNQREADLERLRVALRRTRQTLVVPAAEYVPAIGDALVLLDDALLKPAGASVAQPEPAKPCDDCDTCDSSGVEECQQRLLAQVIAENKRLRNEIDQQNEVIRLYAERQFAPPLVQPHPDATRLDWLIRRVGDWAGLRREGIVAGNGLSREAIDAAMSAAGAKGASA
jgi:hypothetical protein